MTFRLKVDKQSRPVFTRSALRAPACRADLSNVLEETLLAGSSSCCICLGPSLRNSSRGRLAVGLKKRYLYYQNSRWPAAGGGMVANQLGELLPVSVFRPRIGRDGHGDIPVPCSSASHLSGGALRVRGVEGTLVPSRRSPQGHDQIPWFFAKNLTCDICRMWGLLDLRQPQVGHMSTCDGTCDVGQNPTCDSELSQMGFWPTCGCRKSKKWKKTKNYIFMEFGRDPVARAARPCA